MAVESITVGDLVEDVSFIITNSATVDTDLSPEIKKFLSYTMRDMVARSEYPSFRMETTINLVQGTQDYELPDDFGRMIEPGVRHKRDGDEQLTIRYITQPAYDDAEGARWWTETGIPTHYTTTGRDKDADGTYRIRFFPVPDDSYKIQFSYYAVPVSMRSASNSTEIDLRFPRDLAQGLVVGACIYFDKYLTPSQVQTFKEKYGEALQSMQRTADPVSGGFHQGLRPRRLGGFGDSAISRGSIITDDQDNWF
jgi:hypothetical protein